jgi:hypothetical protein
MGEGRVMDTKTKVLCVILAVGICLAVGFSIQRSYYARAAVEGKTADVTAVVPPPAVQAPEKAGETPSLETLESTFQQYQKRLPELQKTINTMATQILVLQGAIARERQLKGLPPLEQVKPVQKELDKPN